MAFKIVKTASALGIIKGLRENIKVMIIYASISEKSMIFEFGLCSLGIPLDWAGASPIVHPVLY